MSNFDRVLAYDDRSADDFQSRGLPHSPVRAGNRVPRTADLRWALGTLPQGECHRWPDGDVDGERLMVGDADQGRRISDEGFAWDIGPSVPGDRFILRGRGPLALALLARLCDRCGQPILWPDTGEAPIIVAAGLDPAEVDRLHRAAVDDDGWDRSSPACTGRVKTGIGAIASLVACTSRPRDLSAADGVSRGGPRRSGRRTAPLSVGRLRHFR